jgi:hypothetical protein
MRQTIKYGHGYENPSPGSGYTPCKAFDGFDVITNPLGGFSNTDRQRRVFPSRSLSNVQVTYGSHAVKLGRETPGRFSEGPERGTLAVLMEHGGGRQLSPLRICQRMDKIEAGLLAMEEEALYFLLYAISETVDDARRQGVEAERERWTKAAAEGRLRKRRAKGGRPARLDVFDFWEMPRAWRDAHNKAREAAEQGS